MVDCMFIENSGNEIGCNETIHAVRDDSSDYTKPSLSTRNLYFGTRHFGAYSAFLSTALRLL
jgi:hypothetical protein